MRRQRNRSQMREAEKSPKEELSEMEAGKLLHTEFKTTIIRLLKELSENFNSIKKNMETIKKRTSQK